MRLRDIAAKLLDIAFPAMDSLPRKSLTDELLSGNHSPLPAIHDDILNSINGQAVYAYRDEHIRAAIKSLKYDGNTDVAQWFADRSEDTITQIIGGSQQKLLIVPIPVSFSRHLERGYNQSALIAEAIARRFSDDIDYDELCVTRTAFTQSQTKARTRSERAKNIIGAFEVKEPHRVVDRDILIVDDVITTGSTIREAARVLRAAGARSVGCFALAH
ncbi:MAG: competence protein ComFC [Patescibacteria group bacterium]|nr:competence protein ComFC [Patescibacteria group bacterium]